MQLSRKLLGCHHVPWACDPSIRSMIYLSFASDVYLLRTLRVPSVCGVCCRHVRPLKNPPTMQQRPDLGLLKLALFRAIELRPGAIASPRRIGFWFVQKNLQTAGRATDSRTDRQTEELKCSVDASVSSSSRRQEASLSRLEQLPCKRTVTDLLTLGR